MTPSDVQAWQAGGPGRTGKPSHSKLLTDLLSFVHDEQLASTRSLSEVWDRPLRQKLDKGWTQGFSRIETGDDSTTIWAWPDAGESRFREGDMLVLHGGDAAGAPLGRGFVFESEDDERWLLRGRRAASVLALHEGGPVYADPDGIDLTGYYEQALEEIGSSEIGREVILPLLNGDLDITFDDRDVVEGEAAAIRDGLNAEQARAVGLAYGAEQVSCIQGPPGTGKTRVLAYVVRLMVERGERVLLTSHTHTAINNALNKIKAQGVPTIKVGRETQCKGLDESVPCHEDFASWADRPTNGYVVGATPFATCSTRLANCQFDVVVFDEASQVTVPLALMAMRKGRRFIFIGDQKQLPPVLLSRSVLDEQTLSIFAALTSRHADHTVMLSRTYRMNRWLTDWPSRTYYDSVLTAAGANRDRLLDIGPVPRRLNAVFDPAHSGVFVPTLDRSARTLNRRDAQLVSELCAAAIDGGVAFGDIGVVTPYRAQGRAIRQLLSLRFGRAAARQIVADTVERMQGQERELIILSLATGDRAFLSTMASFFFQPERLNVSITRPMTKLIVIGPERSTVPDIEDERVRHGVEQYHDLLAHLHRVDL